jgi:hypothetical protein
MISMSTDLHNVNCAAPNTDGSRFYFTCASKFWRKLNFPKSAPF